MYVCAPAAQNVSIPCARRAVKKLTFPERTVVQDAPRPSLGADVGGSAMEQISC